MSYVVPPNRVEILKKAKIERFQDLLCWLKARKLENPIYVATLAGTFSKHFGLKDQINRATGSVMDNITEGFGRNGNKEFIHFLLISRASVLEIQFQLYRALDRNHIDAQQFKAFLDQSEEVISIVTGFVK